MRTAMRARAIGPSADESGGGSGGREGGRRKWFERIDNEGFGLGHSQVD
jgi:hypothetical protein